MTEEYREQNTEQEQDQILANATSELDQDERVSQSVRNVHGVAPWITLALGLFYIGLFIQSREWQIFAVGLSMIASSVLFFSSSNTIQTTDNIERGNFLFLLGLLFLFSGTELFLSGFTVPNIVIVAISGLVYIFIARPRRIWQWVSATFIIAIVILLARGVPLPRISISNTTSFHTSIFPITATITIILYLLSQVLRNLQRGNITFRLIIGFTTASFVPLVIISLINAGLNFTQSQNAVEEKLELRSSLAFNEIDHWVNETKTTLSTAITPIDMDVLEPYMNDRESVEDIDSIYQIYLGRLRQLKLNNETFDEVFLIDPEGKVVISTLRDLLGADVSDEIYFVNASSEFYFQSPQYLPQTNEIISYAAFPLTQTTFLSTESDTQVGMIVAQLNMGSFIQFIRDVNLSPGSLTTETYLVNSDYILISPSRYEGFEVGNSTINTSIVDTAITQNVSGIGEYTTYHNNDEVIGIFHWIPEIQTVLVTEQSQQEAFAPLQQNIIVNVVIAILGSAAALVLGWINTVNISRPIEHLSRTVNAVAQGDLTQKVEVTREDQLGQLGHAVNQMTSQLRDSIENLENTVTDRTSELERRAQYLQAAAEVGQASAQFYSLDDLLVPVTHLISERFQFYHVGIFLIDDLGEYAILRAANSDGGWRMLARGHKLRVGEEGIVGYVTSTGKPRVQQQVGTDEIYFDNPDLPLTRSEMALPLEASGELFGALDVQSTDENAFSEEDVSVLQVLANQVALSIYNARLFDQLQASVEAERRVFGELSREAWSELLKGRTGLNIQATDTNVIPIDARLSPEARQSINEKKTIQTAQGSEEGYSLAIPIKVHGNVVIGLIETNKPAGAGPWLIQEIAVMEAISEQLGIALENARLFDETQRLAFRDRIAADVAGKVWASSDIETILQTTVEELSRALNATQGKIRLRFTETEE